ncbi:MAG: glycosyltransferase, partial [Candidatus Omnitrophica bacterium]|nr:glycosyltransferase [Candidatus Omnitrophota bacterium]
MKTAPDISLAIACYNEAGHLEESVKETLTVMAANKYKYEIIFVDDGSSDNTRDIIRRLCGANAHMSCIFHERNMGRGKAVSDGIRAASGKVAGFIDIDLETHARYIPILIAEIKGGADVACARRTYKVTPGSVNRWLMNRGYNFLVRNFLGLKFYDTETGCKFFNRERILPVLEKVQDNHWFWDTEIIARAYFSGLKISEIPTIYIRRKGKKSTVRILPDIIYYLKKLVWFKREMKKMETLSAADCIRAYWEENPEFFDRYYSEKKGIRSFFVNAFLKKRESNILSALDVINGDKVLDLGCGSGIFIDTLSRRGAAVTGVDISRKMLSLADAKLKAAGIKGYSLILSEASSVPVEDQHYDSVICTGLLDYVYDTKKVLREIHRVLKDSGTAVITIPSKATPFFMLRSEQGGYLRRRLLNLPHILTAVTRAGMVKMLEELDFRIESVSLVYFTM